MPYADAGGVRLYYELRGTGAPVLYINGTGGDLRQLGAFIDPLTARFGVLAYDQRGLGQSESPDRTCSMADYADDAAALLGALGWPRTSVFGMSFGGMVAQELAIRHPDVVERLVLCSTSSGGAGGASFPLHELAGLPAEEQEQRTAAVADTRPEQLESTLRAMKARAAHPLDEAGKVGLRRQIDARAGHDTWDRLHLIQCPTLVASGRYDGVAPPGNTAALASRIPGARCVHFEGGHAFFNQDPLAFEAVLEFLST
jgi:3-oxoadipate enol-lactonase